MHNKQFFKLSVLSIDSWLDIDWQSTGGAAEHSDIHRPHSDTRNWTSAPTLPVRSSAATMKLSLLALAMLAERSSSLLLFVQQPEEGVNNLKAELGKRSDPESDR